MSPRVLVQHRAWLVPVGDKLVKSPLATPFPTKNMRELLNISKRRNIASHGYGMVAQLRSWLPDPIGGVYYVYVDNPHVSTYVPIYAGVQEISSLYKTFNIKQFDEGSARWVVDFVENLMLLEWQNAIKDLRTVRDPLQKEFFDRQSDIENQALALYKENPKKAEKFLTEITRKRMEKRSRCTENFARP